MVPLPSPLYRTDQESKGTRNASEWLHIDACQQVWAIARQRIYASSREAPKFSRTIDGPDTQLEAVLMKNGRHILSKEITIHIDPLAPQSRYLLREGIECMTSVWVPHFIRNEHPRWQPRLQRFHQWQHQPIKGDDEHLVEHANSTDLIDHRFCYVGVTSVHIIPLACLDFDIHLNMSFGQVEYFAQGGYLLRFRPAAGEMGCGVEAA